MLSNTWILLCHFILHNYQSSVEALCGLAKEHRFCEFGAPLVVKGLYKKRAFL